MIIGMLPIAAGIGGCSTGDEHGLSNGRSAPLPQEQRLSTALSALRAAAPAARVLILLIRCALTSPLLLAPISEVLLLLCRRAATTLLLLISALALFAFTLLLAAALLVVLVHQFSLVGPELMSTFG
jgi:hypothetical protein